MVAATEPSTVLLDEGAWAAARWTWTRGEAAGRGTGTLPSAAWRFVPLGTLRGRLGVLGVCADHELDDKFNPSSFFNSDEFFNRVYDIVDLWHEDPEEELLPALNAADSEAEPLWVVQRWSDGQTGWWGFHTPDGFVHFYHKEDAVDLAKKDKEKPSKDWVYLNLNGFTKIEEVQ